MFLRSSLALLILLGCSGLAAAQSLGTELLGHFDLSDSETQYIYNDVWGYSAPDGTELAILGSTVGTHFVDVTDPGAPVQVAYVPGGVSVWRDMKTYGHYAYSVNETGGGIQVVDLSDAHAPRLVNALNAPVATAHNIFVDEEAGTLWVVGANASTPRNVFVYALEPDPSSPELITDWDGVYLHDVYVRDGIAYGAALYSGELWILDARDLPAIEVLARVPTPSGKAHNTWLTDDGRYCLTTDETGGGHIGVFDVTELAAPRLVAEWANPDGPRTIVHNVFVRGSYAYVSWYTAGLQILDLTNPELPTRAGYYDTHPGTSGSFDGAWGAYPFARSGHVYVSDISTGLYVVAFDAARSRLRGRVEDERGAPLGGVSVAVSTVSEPVVTGADGIYEFDLLPGVYDLSASLWGYDSASMVVTVGRSATEAPPLRLVPLPVAAVSGRLVDPSGSPVPAVRVRFASGPLRTTSGSDGTFSFERVPLGDHRLEVGEFGIAPMEFTLDVHSGSVAAGDLVVFAAVITDDLERSDHGWTVGAPDDGAVAGIWEWTEPFDDPLDDTQPDADQSEFGTHLFLTQRGEPGRIAGADDVDGGTTSLLSPRYDLTDLAAPALGFQLWYLNGGDVLPDDEFVVEASVDDGATWVRIWAEDEGIGAWDRVEVALPEDLASSDAVRFRFRASDLGSASRVEAAIDDIEVYDRRGRVSGRILSAAGGEPVAWGRVLVGGEVYLADDEGRFAFLATPGEVPIRFEAFGHQPAGLTVDVPARRNLALDPGLERVPFRRVEGRVRILEDGPGVEGVEVVCLGTPLVTRTDPQGRFGLDLPMGEYRLRFTGEPFESVERVVRVEPAPDPFPLEVVVHAAFATEAESVRPNPSRGESVLRFRLATPADVRIEVFDAHGRRVVDLWNGPREFGEHEVRWDGRSNAGERLPGGLYFVRFATPGVESVHRIVRLP